MVWKSSTQDSPGVAGEWPARWRCNSGAGTRDARLWASAFVLPKESPTFPQVAQPPARRSRLVAPPAAQPCLTENPANHHGRPQWPDFRPGRWGPMEASAGLEGQLEAFRRAH